MLGPLFWDALPSWPALPCLLGACGPVIRPSTATQQWDALFAYVEPGHGVKGTPCPQRRGGQG